MKTLSLFLVCCSLLCAVYCQGNATSTAAPTTSTAAPSTSTAASVTSAVASTTTAAKQTTAAKKTTAVLTTQTAAPNSTTAAKQTTAAKKTTAVLTTQTAAPNSTTAASNMTTAAPTTETPVITTATPAPAVADYVVMKNETKCLLANVGITFTLFYQIKGDNETKSKAYEVTNASVSQSSSKCAANDSDSATLVLTFDKSSNLTLTFKNKNKQAVIDSIELWYNASAVLPNTTESGMTPIKKANLGLVMSSVDKYYECDVSLPERLAEKAVVQFSDSKIQVYNVKNAFAAKYDECMQDKPVPDHPAVGNFSVTEKGKQCIRAEMSVRLDIPYTTYDNKKANLTVDVPASSKVSGTCGGPSQTMTIPFYDDWSVVLTFGKDKNKNNALTNMSLIYYMDDHFVNASLSDITGKQMISVNNSLDAFPVSTGQVYKCVSANTTLKLEGGVVVQVGSLMVESFRTTNSTDFSKTVIECSADNKTNSIVPIAVGAALAGLVVIVLIAYLIGRRRSHKGYQSV